MSGPGSEFASGDKKSNNTFNLEKANAILRELEPTLASLVKYEEYEREVFYALGSTYFSLREAMLLNGFDPAVVDRLELYCRRQAKDGAVKLLGDKVKRAAIGKGS